MRYIISESRMDDLVMNYLDIKLKNLEEHVDAIGGGFHHWWGFGTVPLFMVVGDDGKGIEISNDITRNLQKLFNLSYNIAQGYVFSWFRKNIPLEIKYFRGAEYL